MRRIIIIFILCLCSNAYGAYTGTMPKDIGTSTPAGTENPGIIDDAVRERGTVQYNLYKLKFVGTDTTILTNDTWIIGSSSTGMLFTMPLGSSCANSSATKPFYIKNYSTGTITLNITVDGVGSPTVSGSQTMCLFTDGTLWYEIGAKNAYDAEYLGGVIASGYARSGANSDITAITGLTTYLAIGQGGSGTNTAAGAASTFGVGTEDTPTLTGVVATGSSTLTTLNSTTGNVTNLSTTTGTVTTLYSTTGNITNQATTTGTITTLYNTTGNITNLVTTTGTVTTLNSTTSNITTGNITNQVTTTGTVTTLNSTTGNVTNLNTTTGTVTTLNSTTGNVTNQVTTTGTITTLNNTNLTTTTGTITTLNNTNFSGGSGTFTGNVQAASATGFDFLKQWAVGSVVGTGSVTFVESTGIDLAATYANGVGTITITGVGTSSAGGWTNTGTQTIGLAGDQVLPGGTLTIHADYGITGLTDAWIPNTITLDNLTQITTRNYSDLTGTSTISPTTATITTAVITNLTATYGTITNVYGVGYDDISGSATASQVPLISGLIGSVTSAQLPNQTVLKVYGTTTQQNSGEFQLINLQSGTSSTIILPQATQAGTQLHLRMHGTTTVDSSANNYTISAFGVTGTTGVTFNTGTFSAYFDGVDDYLTVPSSTNWVVGTTGTTIRVKFQTPTPSTTMKLLNRASGSGVGFWQLRTLTPDGRLQFYHEDGLGTPIIAMEGGSVTANSINYVEVVKAVSANSMYLFLGGNLVAQGTLTQSMGDSAQPLYIGLDSGLNQDFKGYMKDIEILQGVALHTATFTVDTTSNYELATMNRQAIRSADGIERITVQTYSTDTAKAAIIFNNGSLTAFGYKSESGMSAPGSTTAYSTESLNAEIATNFIVKSKDIKGRNFQKLTETCLDKVVNTNLWSWNPINHKNINRLEAEAIAKEAFVKQGKQDWDLLHENEYILATTVNGTETATVRDYVRMERDYKNYIELEWAYSLEQTGWIDTVKDNLESDTTIRRRGFRYDDSTTPEELKEPGGIGLSEATALSFKAIQELEAIVGSLSTTLKSQEIAHNEEVDNLYQLINAVIVALLAVGGVSGWSTIRRKRKGT